MLASFSAGKSQIWGKLMNFAELRRLSDQDVSSLFNSIPSPSCSESINTDPQSMESILHDFNAREIPHGDREALRNDLNRARGYSPDAQR